MRRLIAPALLVFVLQTASARAAGLNLYSVEREIALGRQLAAEVEKQAHIVDDPLLSEYVNRLGQQLAQHAKLPFPVSFTLLESEEINAFTLPGGHVYLNTGLFRLSDNEAELASALAHELAHAAARHATRQASREQLMNTPLNMLGGWGRLAGTLASPLASFHFSRAFESEADEMGLGYLSAAGYDPNASVDLFERVEAAEKRQPGRVSRLFRTHPPTPDRIARTQKTITGLSTQAQYILNTSEYEDMRLRLKAPAVQPEK